MQTRQERDKKETGMSNRCIYMIKQRKSKIQTRCEKDIYEKQEIEIYIHTYIYTYTHTHICAYRDTEREREAESEEI